MSLNLKRRALEKVNKIETTCLTGGFYLIFLFRNFIIYSIYMCKVIKKFCKTIICVMVALLAVSFVGCGKKPDPSTPKPPPGYNYGDVYEITESEAERVFKGSYALLLDKFEQINEMSPQLFDSINKNSANGSGYTDCIMTAMNNLEFIGVLGDYFSDNREFYTNFFDGNCKFRVNKPNVDKILEFEYLNYTNSYLEDFIIRVHLNEGNIDSVEAQRIVIDKLDFNMKVSGVEVDFLSDTLGAFYGDSKVQGDIMEFAENIVKNYGTYYWNVTAVVKYDFKDQSLDCSGYINQREPSTIEFKPSLQAAKFENVKSNLLSFDIGKSAQLTGDYRAKIAERHVSFKAEDCSFEYDNLSKSHDSV